MKKILLITFALMLTAVASQAQQREMTRKNAPSPHTVAHQAPVMAAESVNEEYLAYCSEDVWPVGAGEEPGTISLAAYFPADIVKRLIGNELVGIATQMYDATAQNLRLWVARSLDEDPFLSVNVAEGYPVNTPIRVDFDQPYQLTQAEGLYIGMTMDITDPTVAGFYCDWTDRNNALLWKAPGKEWEDWSHTYNGSLYILGITQGDKLFANTDVAIRNVTSNRAIFNTESEATLNIYNYGKKPIQSLDISYTVDGKTLTSQVALDYNVNQFETASFNLPITAPSKEGRNIIDYTITKANGLTNTSYPEASRQGYLICMQEAYPRTILVEQTESTYDEWSSVSNLVMTNLNNYYADKAIGLGVHSTFLGWGKSKLACDTYSPITSVLTTPYLEFINRKYVINAYNTYWDEANPTDCFTLGTLIDYLNTTPSEGQITLQAAYTSEEMTELTFQSSVIYSYSSQEEIPYRLAYILVEKSVEGYTMLNRFNEDFVLDELCYGDLWEFDYYWSTLPPELRELGEIPYETTDIPYLNVARAIYDCYGIEGSLTGTITKGETKTHTYTVTLPPTATKVDDLYAIAILLDGYSGEAINATRCEITGGAAVTTTQLQKVKITAHQNTISITGAQNAKAEIYSLDGHLIASQPVNGATQIHIDNTADQILIARVTSGHDVTVRRLIIK